MTAAAPAQDLAELVVKAFPRIERALYSRDMSGEVESVFADLLKQTNASNASTQGTMIGVQQHPFNMRAVTRLQFANEHHSTCIHTRVASMVGLGFMTDEERALRMAQRTGAGTPAVGGGGATAPQPMTSLADFEWRQSEVDDALDPLCTHSWQDTLRSVAEDYAQCANGYIEVVRAAPGSLGLGPISGLHHIPAPEVDIVIEDSRYNRHYIVNGEGVGSGKPFAVFGDLAAYINRRDRGSLGGFSLVDPNARNTISEIIHFRRPNAINRYYGVPHWLSCAAAIELVQCLRQHKYDFFNNRGVPEFFLWLMGMKISEKDWTKIETATRATIGRGNAFKSLAMNFHGDQDKMKIQIDKLEADSKTMDSLDAVNETYNLAIVTAHQVPPILAGILIPGKLGSANELPNALRAYQALSIGPEQRVFQQTLRRTLANTDLNGGLALKPDQFTLRRITDEFDMAAMDTSSRMRQTEVQAQQQGRNLSAGVKD